jgi:hypothetical protein
VAAPFMLQGHKSAVALTVPDCRAEKNIIDTSSLPFLRLSEAYFEAELLAIIWPVSYSPYEQTI